MTGVKNLIRQGNHCSHFIMSTSFAALRMPKAAVNVTLSRSNTDPFRKHFFHNVTLDLSTHGAM